MPLVFVSFWSWDGDYWHTKWFVAYCVLAAWLSFQVGVRSHWSVGLAGLSTVLSSAWVFGWRYNEYWGSEPDKLKLLYWVSSQAAFAFLLVSLPVVLARFNTLKNISRAFVVMIALDSIKTLLEFALGDRARFVNGFFGNSSLNASLIATCIPLIFLHNSAWSRSAKFQLTGLSVLAVIASRSSIGFGILAALVVVYSLKSIARMNKRAQTTTIVCIPVILGLLTVIGLVSSGTGSSGGALFDTSGRTNFWPFFMTKWHELFFWWSGSGNGTYFAIGPYLQETNNKGWPGAWLWLHSDFLQLIFEQGIIGLITYGAMIGVLFKRAWNDVNRLALLVAYCCMAAMNFPCHLPVHGFLGVYTIIIILRGNKNAVERQAQKIQ